MYACHFLLLFISLSFSVVQCCLHQQNGIMLRFPCGFALLWIPHLAMLFKTFKVVLIFLSMGLVLLNGIFKPNALKFHNSVCSWECVLSYSSPHSWPFHSGNFSFSTVGNSLEISHRSFPPMGVFCLLWSYCFLDFETNFLIVKYF